MSIAQWKNKVSRFGELSGADKWLLLSAAAWLAIARIMLVAMSFRRLSAQLSSERVSPTGEPDAELLQRIGIAVRRAANNVPWRADCFPQAIAARMLIRRRGIASTLHFGVERGAEIGLAGHAWLTCGEVVVVGGENLDRYTEMHRLST